MSFPWTIRAFEERTEMTSEKEMYYVIPCVACIRLFIPDHRWYGRIKSLTELFNFRRI